MTRSPPVESQWGYDRILGALANLGHNISDTTVGNILREHGAGVKAVRLPARSPNLNSHLERFMRSFP
jgi:hypothetical protein